MIATDDKILASVVEIVTAHVGRNIVAAAELPELIEEPRRPAVSVRASVKPHALVCLDCGRKFKTLKHHLAHAHGLTPAEYRLRWALQADYPIVAPDYAARRKELALANGLGGPRPHKFLARRRPGRSVGRRPA